MTGNKDQTPQGGKQHQRDQQDMGRQGAQQGGAQHEGGRSGGERQQQGAGGMPRDQHGRATTQDNEKNQPQKK